MGRKRRNQLNFGLTGPSSYTVECINLIYQKFRSNAYFLVTNDWKTYVDRCHGIILAGGADIHPVIYGKGFSSEIGRTDYERDMREMEIIDYCIGRIPILGICRGLQEIAVYHKLQLIPDLPPLLSDGSVHIDHHPEKHLKTVIKYGWPVHSVLLEQAAVNDYGFKSSIIPVNSFHHQGIAWDSGSDKIRHLGKTSSSRGWIIELMDGEGWVACQWHPEFDWGMGVGKESSDFVLQRFRQLIND